MKKITFVLVLTALATVAFSQESNNMCVWSAMSTYNGGGSSGDLERAMKCSDEAIANEATNAKSKTWYYRGQLYTLVYQDTTLRKSNGTSLFEAVKAFKKLADLNDPKFKDWDDVYKFYLGPDARNAFNAAIDQYRAKNFTLAYQYFYLAKDISAIYAVKGQKSPVDLATSLRNASKSAEYGGNAGDAYKVMEEVYKMEPDTVSNITALATIAKKVGNNDRYNQVINEGLAKYPKDPTLLKEKINMYLAKEDYPGALEFVNSLLSLDPLNDGALTAKGLAYQSLLKSVTGKLDSLGTSAADQQKRSELNAKAASYGDSLLEAYTRATTINAKNLNAWTNLGVYYIDKAVVLNTAMNKLGNTAEDTKKYDQMKKQLKDLYLKAKPYFEKAKEIEPNDTQVNRILKQIAGYTAE